MSSITDASELLRQKVDVLLERLADRVMSCPAPGSKAWYAHWRASADSPKDRLLVRIAIAHHAQFDFAEDIVRARAAGALWSEIAEVTGTTASLARRRWDSRPPGVQRRESGQLAIW